MPSETEVLDEVEALSRAQHGDQEAFGHLVGRYEQLSFRTAYLVVRDEMEAQDVAQEAFVRAYSALPKFDRRRPFKPWLLRIVMNLAINSLRSSNRRRALAERFERERPAGRVAPSPELHVESGEEARRVWQAVAALPSREQELVYLRYFLDCSEEELAATIRRPRGTVKSRLHRSLRRLRDVIERDYPDLAPEPASGLLEKEA